MPSSKTTFNRRGFMIASTGLAALAALPLNAATSDSYYPDDQGLHIVGPREGFSPQVGTLVSMMNWMRATVLRSVKKLSKEELDFLFDAKSNTIGAMLMHLAATETFYQLNTFEGRDDYNDSEKKRWEAAMTLGDQGRSSIKGNDLDYYLSTLKEVREKTLAEFKKRDDAWLMKVDPSFFGKQPTNNYCKWFHVCEHESNHNGQIKFLLSRLPNPDKSGKE